MKMILNKYFILLLIMFINSISNAQNNYTLNDSIEAEKIYKRSFKVTNPNVVKLNMNGLTLDLTKRETVKIAKIILYSIYGKTHILQQKPFHVFKKQNYWIIWGDFKRKKKRYGGVFEIIINSQNGSVEYLSHGK